MGILQELGEILPDWAKKLICLVVTIVKFVVVLLIVAFATYVVLKLSIAAFLAVCVVGGVFTGGITCFIVIIVLIILFTIFAYIAYRIVSTVLPVFIQEYCTVFQ